MTQRILIISDTHLACPRSRVKSPTVLRPLWQGFTNMVVNGDVAEIHHPSYRAKAARQTLLLHSLCERDGVDLTFLSGNHDGRSSSTAHPARICRVNSRSSKRSGSMVAKMSRTSN